VEPLDPTTRRPSDADPPDDVDRLFARLTQLPPPRGFTANVMVAVQSYRLGWRQVAWMAAELAAVVVLAVLAFVTGQAFVGGGTLALLGAMLADAEVISAFPVETAVSLLESVPWLELLLLLAAVMAVTSCARRLGRSLAEPPTATARGVA